MNLNAPATHGCLKGLKCPYTGKEIKVQVVAAYGRMPVFIAWNCFDPSIPDPSADKMASVIHQRDGVFGAHPETEPPVCAYTGRQLVLRKTPTGFCYDGAFSPTVPYSDPERLAYELSMRDGVAGRPEPGAAKPDVVSAAESAEPEPAQPDPGVSDLACETAAQIMRETNMSKATTVAMSGDFPRRRRKG